MKLSKTELNILEQISKGNRNIREISKTLKKSKSQIYRSAQKLIKENFINLSNSFYESVKNTHSTILIQLLGEFPSLIVPFSNSGIDILKCLIEPKTVKELIQKSGVKRTQLFKKIKQARAISLLKIIGNQYQLNDKLWKKAVDFLKELRKYEEINDQRVPANSTIYFKNKKEIVFSNKETINAAPTAFSAYKNYGLKFLLLNNYYYLPNKKLSIKEVFMHSVYIVEKEMIFQHIIFIALFYAKYRKELSKVKHIIIENINNIFKGKRIPEYPTLEEIKDRAEVYDIKL